MVAVNSLSFVAPFMGGCCFSSITHWVYAYSNFFRHDDGFTLTYSQAFMRSPKSGARSQGIVNFPHKDGAHDLDLTDQMFQPVKLRFWTKQLKWGEGKIQKRTYLALSILLLQGKIGSHGIFTEESGSREYSSCAVKSQASKEKQAALEKMLKDSMDLRGRHRGEFMHQLAEENVSVPSNLDIPPPIL